MDSVRKILTPSAIWKDFNGDLPLKESKVNEMTYDGITYIEVYFSGRETESGRVRIYGLYARPQPLPTNRNLGAILVLPDCDQTVDLETVNYFARMGYAVLMVDYRGNVGENTNHTNYPTEIDYANYGREDIFKVERTAKETCWYEWVSVGKYALAYLKSRPEVEKIGVVGIKQGANIGWQLLYNENRVSCFIPIFGIGWQAYKGVHKADSGDIEMNDERYRWLGGVDAHVYAQYVNCPVLYLAGTNSSDFDCERGTDTLARVPECEKRCVWNYAPRLRNVINKKCGNDIALFLKKHLSRAGAASDKLYFPNPPAVSLAMGEDGCSIFAEVIIANEDKLKSINVYLNEGINEPSKRNWALMQPVKGKTDGSKRYFKLQLGGGADFVNAFAVADYKNGVSISSKMVIKKIKPAPITVANMLFTSKNGADCFTIYNEVSNSIGKLIFSENSGVEIAECANGITGATSRFGLLTYRIGEKRFSPNSRSIIKMDVYCEDYTQLAVSVMIGTNEQFIPYTATVQLKGSKVWQKVQIGFSEFKNEARMGIKNYEDIIALRIDAESRFAVNNLLLI